MAVAPTQAADRGPRRWTLVVVAVIAALAVLLVAGAFVYDNSHADTIAPGVRIAGVPVGGLDRAQARARLQAQLLGNLEQPVVVVAGSRHWQLTPQQAKLKLNVAAMVDEAVHASREGSFLSRTWREVTGGSVSREVALANSYSHSAVQGLVAQVRSQVDKAPVNATVEPGPGGLHQVASQDGLAVDGSALGARIDRALLGLTPTREVRVPAHHTRPKVTTANLAAAYPAYIVVDRASFRLMFYSHLKLSKTYEIAVGMEGLETPAGLHHIEWEQVDPPWYVPDKAWAGSLAGTVVPPGPGDPLKARFMSFDGGAGIHGIDPSEYSSIGHDASHGCVRMRIPDVIALYAVSPVGTPVYII